MRQEENQYFFIENMRILKLSNGLHKNLLIL